MKRSLHLSLFSYAVCAVFIFGVRAVNAQTASTTEGLILRVYDTDVTLAKFFGLAGQQTPNVHKIIPFVDFQNPALVGQTVYQDALGDLQPQNVTLSFDIPSTFIALIDGELNVPLTGTYEFRLTSADGSIFQIDGVHVVNNDGVHGSGQSTTGSRTLTAGYHTLHIDCFLNAGTPHLLLEWKPPGTSSWARIPQNAFRTENDFILATEPGLKRLDLGGLLPGDGTPLDAVHPSFDLVSIRPAVSNPPAGMPVDSGRFDPQVGNMTLLPGGDLLVTDYGDSASGRKVWRLSGIANAIDPSTVTVSQYAGDFTTNLAIETVDADHDGQINNDANSPADGVYVLDTTGMYRLRDLNSDGDALDTSENVLLTFSNPAGDIKLPGDSSGHQFNFGMVWKDGYLWASLSSALGGGLSTRGHLIKLDPVALTMSVMHSGLRTPNGLGIGVDNELFGSDNQGNWLPANKLNHYPRTGPGKWFGFHNAHALGNFDTGPIEPPTLWLPHGEIDLSPSQPLAFDSRTQFADQMVLCELTGGGANRVFLEKVNGVYQGAVFRFTQGLEVGLMAARWLDGNIGGQIRPQLVVGGLGSGGHVWNWNNTRRGLQKLVYNGNVPFEMLAVRAAANGFEIEFTKPVDPALALDPSSYALRQWHYVPTADYGGPKIGDQELSVRSISVSTDRKKVFLEIPNIATNPLGNVVYFHLRGLKSDIGAAPWATEAWYTLHSKPAASGPAFVSLPVPAPNLALQLKANWKLDGNALDSTGIFNGVVAGAISAPGKVSGALQFDGIDDMVNIPSAALNLGGNFSISAWIRSPITGAAEKTILARGSRGPGGYEIYLTAQNELQFYSAELGTIASGVVLGNNTWQHIAVTYSIGVIKFYLDGRFVVAKTATGTIPDGVAIVGIGANAAENARHFIGLIDELRVYERTVTSAEIALLASGSGLPYYPTSGLLAYYPFSEGTGTATEDHSGGRAHGIQSSGTWVTGKRGSALQFNGFNGGVNLGSIDLNLAGSFTIACFVKGTNFAGQRTLLQKEAVAEFADYHFYLESGSPRFASRGHNVVTGVGDGNVPADGNWHHVAFSYDGVAMRAYIDGALAWTSGIIWGILTGESAPTAIASKAGLSNQTFPGSIDEFFVYSRPLQASEVARLAAAILTGPLPVITTPSLAVSDTFQVAISFSVPVTGLSVEDFVIVNGVSLSLTGSGSSYNLAVSPSAVGPLTVFLPPGSALDAGNASSSISTSLDLNATGVPPLTVQLTTSSFGVSGPFTVDVGFNREITSLTPDDFSIFNGTANTLFGWGNRYQLTVTPDSEGDTEVVLPAGSVTGSGSGDTNSKSNALIVMSQTQILLGTGPGGVGTTDGSSRLELWLRADSLAGTADSEVTNWPDLSGNGRDATTTTDPAARPTLASSAGATLNGHAVARFTSDRLDDIPVETDGGTTVFAVIKPNGNGYYNVFEFRGFVRPMLWIDLNGKYEYSFASPTGAVATREGGWDLLIMRQSASGVPQLYRNSTSPTVSGTGTFTAPASDYLSLFNRTGNSTSPFKGDVAELIFFGTQLSDGDVAKVGGYLAARYGLSVPFPALPDAYALWVASKFPSGSLSGTTAKTADPDHDGRVNLEEFFHASDPLQPDTAAATTQAELLQTSVGDFVTLKFRMANPLPEELTWQIETSQDLAFWSDSPGWLRRTLSNGPGWKIMQFRSASPIPTGINKAFYRLLLEAP